MEQPICRKKSEVREVADDEETEATESNHKIRVLVRQHTVGPSS